MVKYFPTPKTDPSKSEHLAEQGNDSGSIHDHVVPVLKADANGNSWKCWILKNSRAWEALGLILLF